MGRQAAVLGVVQHCLKAEPHWLPQSNKVGRHEPPLEKAGICKGKGKEPKQLQCAVAELGVAWVGKPTLVFQNIVVHRCLQS